MSTDDRQPWEGWALVELMGHRKRAGYVTQEEVAGVAMVRIDSPGPNDAKLTAYYSPASLYSLTPVSEEVARGFAAGNTPAPVSRYELPPPPTVPARVVDPDDQVDEHDDDEDIDEESRY